MSENLILAMYVWLPSSDFTRRVVMSRGVNGRFDSVPFSLINKDRTCIVGGPNFVPDLISSPCLFLMKSREICVDFLCKLLVELNVHG